MKLRACTYVTLCGQVSVITPTCRIFFAGTFFFAQFVGLCFSHKAPTSIVYCLVLQVSPTRYTTRGSPLVLLFRDTTVIYYSTFSGTPLDMDQDGLFLILAMCNNCRAQKVKISACGRRWRGVGRSKARGVETTTTLTEDSLVNWQTWTISGYGRTP